MFVIRLYFVHHTSTVVCARVVFIVSMFSTDTPLPGGAKQLSPTTCNPSEVFTAGMCDVPMVLYSV